MVARVLSIVAAIVLALFALTYLDSPPGPGPLPVPLPKVPPPKPKRPCPPDKPCPRVEASVGGRTAPDGAGLQIDLPGAQHIRNTGGRDGAGLCVFASLTMAARWHSVEALYGLFEFMKTQPGGGYPEKVDKMIAALCAKQGVPVPEYVQVQGLDLPLIERAVAAGHMVCNTYYRSPTGRYGGRQISHMVDTVHAKDKVYGILDNNYTGENAYEYMDEAEYTKAVGGKQAWCVILLRQGPPPIPRNP